MFLKIERQKKATIGEMSIIPIGGMSFLKGERNISENAFIDLKGSLYQFIFGNQLNKIVTNKTKKIKSNILATAIAMPILFLLSPLSFYFLLSNYHFACASQEQVLLLSIFSTILNKSF